MTRVKEVDTRDMVVERENNRATYLFRRKKERALKKGKVNLQSQSPTQMQILHKHNKRHIIIHMTLCCISITKFIFLRRLGVWREEQNNRKRNNRSKSAENPKSTSFFFFPACTKKRRFYLRMNLRDVYEV